MIRFTLGMLMVWLVLFSPQYAAASVSETTTLSIEVPEYVVESSGGYDFLEIPGGSIILAEEGRPRIPCYTHIVDYPPEQRLQDVILLQTSAPEVRSGLKLPIVVLQWMYTQPVVPVGGWYPDVNFDWYVTEKPGGGHQLAITVYPVRYNQDTSMLEFIRHYSFEVGYVLSSVEITGFVTDKTAYEVGESVLMQVDLQNSGLAQDVYIDAVVRSYGSNELVGSLPVRLLKDLARISSYSVSWSSTVIPAGNYLAEIVVSDQFGNRLSVSNTAFALVQVATTQNPSPTATPWLDSIPITWIVAAVGGVLLLLIILALLMRGRKK